MIFIFTVLIMYSQEHRDTVKIIDDVEKITLIKGKNKTSVEAFYFNKNGKLNRYIYEIEIKNNKLSGEDIELDENWGIDLPFYKFGSRVEEDNKTHRSGVGISHFYIGKSFNFGTDMPIKDSFDIGILDVMGIKWSRKNLSFETGIGFGLHRMLAKDGFQYAKTDDGIFLIPNQDGKKISCSRLDMWSFKVPLLGSVGLLGNKGSLTFGAVINFNTYSKAYTKGKENNVKFKYSYKGLQQNLLSLDLIGMVHLKEVGIYLSVDPVKHFRKEFGPTYRNVSVGFDFKL